jgi:hypothetical protein
MKRSLVLPLCVVMLLSLSAFAVDGVVLINQASVTASGGTYTITQPGSYKLSGNLQAKDPNTDVIVIAADNVTIDLNGFAIMGTTACGTGPTGFNCTNTGNGRGIATSAKVAGHPDFFNITIRNGAIQGMGYRGIDLSGDSFLIEYVHVDDSGESGIATLRQNGQQVNVILQHNNLRQNGRDGVSMFGGGAVTDNVSTNNRFSGVAFLFNGTISIGTVARNVLSNNGTFGFYADGLSGSYTVNLIGNVLVGNGSGPNFGGLNQGQNLCITGSCPGATF